MSFNFSNRVVEIRDFFAHGDFEPGRRRLLDLAYDSDDSAILSQCISWSRLFPDNDKAPGQDVLSQVENLLSQMEKVPVQDAPVQLLFKAEGVSKTYRAGHFKLSDISMDVMAGQVIGIVGENGQGKTTFLRQVATELLPDRGEISYNYVKDRVNFYYDVKNATGFIPQRIPKWWGVLRDNLAFTASIHGYSGEKNDLYVDFVLERFGLSKYQNLTWKQISSGYRTRFEIARIILLRPALLILDEPLANLDINAQQTLLQDLKYLAASNRHPMGVLLSSQQLYEVEKIANEVMFIKNGKAVWNSIEVMDDNAPGVCLVELETQSERDVLVSILGDKLTDIKFNGGLYQLQFQGSPGEIMGLLGKANIDIKYFRDISQSTKRFF